MNSGLYKVPVFSIIIPSYNAASTIGKALIGIIYQTYKDWEIIIIDGNSTDNTLQVIRDHAQNDNRINFISGRDEGIYDAMNKGINLARGEWLYFLGADDTLFDKTVLQDISTVPDINSTNVLYGNVEISGNNAWARHGDIYDGRFDTKKIFNKNICHQGVFYKTNFIKNRIGYFNTNYRLCADWDLNLRCWSKTSFVYYNRIIARFNTGGESTKSSSDTNFNNDLVNNLVAYFNITIFDSLIANPGFWQYSRVLQLQRKKSYLRYITTRLKHRLKFFFE